MLDYILSNNSFEILLVDITNSRTLLKQCNIAFAVYLYFQMIWHLHVFMKIIKIHRCGIVSSDIIFPCSLINKRFINIMEEITDLFFWVKSSWLTNPNTFLWNQPSDQEWILSSTHFEFLDEPLEVHVSKLSRIQPS
jgi:hypothetical protein